MRLNSDYVLKEALGTSILVNKKTNKYIIKLNDSSKMIFEYVLNGKNIDEIIDLMLKEYSVNKDTVSKDVNEFIQEMIEKKIIIND